MSETKNYILCVLALVSVAIGAYIPSIFIEVNVHGSTMERAQNVIYISVLFFTLFGFNRAGRKLPKLKEWSTNTIIGVVLMVFVFGFINSFFSRIFMLLPLPSWLLLTISLFLGLVASACIFLMLANEGEGGNL